MGLAGCCDIVIRFILLQHQLHHYRIFRSIAPVSFGIQTAYVETVLQPLLDARNRPGDFSGDKGFPSSG